MMKTAAGLHSFRGYDVIATLIVVLTLVANMVAFKMVEIGPFTLRLGVVVATTTFVLADILVEVYGFARARRVIWLTTLSLALMFIVFKGAVAVPGAAEWKNAEQFNAVFNRDGFTMAITLLVIWAGQFVNALIMVKMKLMLDGKSFWLRALTSSFVAAGFTLIVFYTFANIPGMAREDIVPAIVMYEAVLLPITSAIVTMLKKIENVDVFDAETNLNPFRFSLVKPAAIFKQPQQQE
jgi:queuosine precursor transporter